MAGDWIKMRSDLRTHPKVVLISSRCHRDIFGTIGGLHSVWSVFDAHSIDGTLEGYTPETMDVIAGFPGLVEAMASVGWIIIEPEKLICPRFDSHNSKSAKNRATEQEKKRNQRTSRFCPDSVPMQPGQMSRSERDTNGTREEKRREEKNSKATPTPSQGNSADADQAETEEPSDFTDISGSSLEFVRDSWNASGPITCIRLTEKLRRAARARLKVPWWSEHWLLALERLPQCRFLWGESDRGWKADLEWFLKPDSVQKILEGKYDNGSTESKSREQSTFDSSIDAIARVAAKHAARSREGSGSSLCIEANGEFHGSAG